MARVFAVRVQIAGSIRVSRYKINKEQRISHGTQTKKKPVAWSALCRSEAEIGARGSVKMHKTVKRVGAICKNRDKQMPYIVRVSV